MDFSDTVEVKVVDKDPHFAIDSYFFAYFHDLPTALDQIRDAVRSHRSLHESGAPPPQEVLDTTTSRSQVSAIDRTTSLPIPGETKEKSASSSMFKIPSVLKPFHSSRPASASTLPPVPADDSVEEFTHISHRPNSSSFVPVTSSGSKSLDYSSSSTTLTPSNNQGKTHTYPPSILSEPPLVHRESTASSGLVSTSNSWSVGVPSWLKGTRTRVRFGTGSSEPAPVKEVYSSSVPTASSKWSSTGDMAFSVLETPEIAVDPEIVERFRTAFAYDEKETLLGCKSFFNCLYFN